MSYVLCLMACALFWGGIICLFDGDGHDPENPENPEHPENPPEEEVNKIIGTDDDDSLFGTMMSDIILAGDGNDTASGLEGDDLILGEEGDDSLMGGEGADTLLGGQGLDTLEGGIGDDSLYGGIGNDELYGGEGEDELRGGQGYDRLDGGDGTDFINGLLDSANDEVIDEADVYDHDYLIGGEGDDLILMGSGDVANGGEGADIFGTGTYVGDGEAPFVEDFMPGEDELEVLVAAGATGSVSVVDDAGTAVVSVDGQIVAYLSGVGATLTADDIVIVERSAA